MTFSNDKRQKDADAFSDLLKNASLFEILVQSSSNGITIVDKDRNLIFRNRASRNMSGYSNEELNGLNQFELAHPDDRESNLEEFKEFTKQPGAILKNTMRIRHKLGHYIWLEMVHYNFLEEKTVAGIVTTIKDISKEIIFKNQVIDFRRELSILNLVSDIVLKNKSPEDIINNVCAAALSENFCQLSFSYSVDIINNKVNLGDVHTEDLQKYRITANEIAIHVGENILLLEELSSQSNEAEQVQKDPFLILPILNNSGIIIYSEDYNEQIGPYIDIFHRVKNNLAFAISNIEKKKELDQLFETLQEQIRSLSAVADKRV